MTSPISRGYPETAVTVLSLPREPSSPVPGKLQNNIYGHHSSHVFIEFTLCSVYCTGWGFRGSLWHIPETVDLCFLGFWQCLIIVSPIRKPSLLPQGCMLQAQVLLKRISGDTFTLIWMTGLVNISVKGIFSWSKISVNIYIFQRMQAFFLFHDIKETILNPQSN